MTLIAQLKQRKLVQWALAYAAAAFALLQGVDIVAHQFDWPADVQRGITLALVLGFFVACLLAWYHGERGAQRVSGTELVILALLLTIGGATIWLLAPDRALSERVASAPEPTSAAHTIRSIAVLPLDNYSGDSKQDYFAEGMTDQLTADLATISKLRVISRGSTTQFKGDHRPATPEIAKILDVDAVLEGSVQRVGDHVRITAQLIDARADKHLWAKSFDGNSRDVLALQAELATTIAREIDVQLTPGEQTRLSSAPTVQSDAYDAYIKGRYFFNRPSDENLSKAIAQFELAVKLAPGFAPAYSGLSDAYLWAGINESVFTSTQARAKAKSAAEQAVRLDDDSAEAHTSLAVFKVNYEYDWSGSEVEFRRAFALNPSYAFAHSQFAVSLALQGRFDESIAETRIATELDPLSPQVAIDGTFALAWQAKYQQAKALAARAGYLDPHFYLATWSTGWIDIQAGQVREAIPELERAKAMESPGVAIAWLGYAYAATGDRTRALEAIKELRQRSLHGYVAPFNLAVVSLGLGDRARALDYLEQAYEADSQWLGWIRNDRIFDPLRSESRFISLMRKIGFGE